VDSAVGQSLLDIWSDLNLIILNLSTQNSWPWI